MANITWNGSSASVGGAAVTPLTELHAPNDPPGFDTTGSTDTTKTNGTGKHKCQATCGFLGSQFPGPGVVSALAFTIGTGSGNTYANTGMPGAPALAFATQVSVSGRKDGRIEGNATLVPADPSLTAVTHTVTAGDVGFNGHAFSFGAAFTGIVGANYSGTCQPIDSTGAEASAPVATVSVPGIAEETITITTLGPPQAVAKATGTCTNTWNDGGTLGTTPSGYTAECVSTHPGGQVDGQNTTEHTFKWRRTGTGSS